MVGAANIRRTVAFRLAAGLGAVFTLAALALIAVIFAMVEQQLTARTDQVLVHELDRLTALPAPALPPAIGALIANSASGLNYYALTARDGHLIAGNFTPPPRMTAHAAAWEAPAGSIVPAPLRLMSLDRPDGTRIAVARDITQIAAMRGSVLTVTLGSAAAVIVIALLTGAILARGPLARVGEVQAIAARIAAGELALRMPVTRHGDELDLIAGMVNAMLDEIERLLTEVKGATDAIAHDLRTPLAHLRQRLARLLPGDDDPADGPVAAVVSDALGDVDQVLRRFNALLRISELEATNRRAGFAPLDPMTLLAEIAELFEPLAEARDIRLLLQGSFGQTIVGDQTLLLEAISNLVENALKFTGPEGTVHLAVMQTDRATIIEVRDNGPGIPAADRVAVMGRFRRGAGTARVAGHGLGLSLVAAIINLHGFALTLEDGAPGLIVAISAPRIAPVKKR